MPLFPFPPEADAYSQKIYVMKTLLLTSILFFIKKVYAGGGGAGSSESDIYIVPILIAFLLLILGILYLITFFKNKKYQKMIMVLNLFINKFYINIQNRINNCGRR